jgi:hypothetical protein
MKSRLPTKCPAKCRHLDGAKSSIYRGLWLMESHATSEVTTVGPLSQPATGYPLPSPHPPDSPATRAESARAIPRASDRRSPFIRRGGQLTWRRPEPRLVGRDLSWWNRKIQHR